MLYLLGKVRAQNEAFSGWVDWVQGNTRDPIDGREGDKQKDAARDERHTPENQRIVVPFQPSILLDLDGRARDSCDDREADKSTTSSLTIGLNSEGFIYKVCRRAVP